ncbi:unnamed protein product [Clonostachys rosea]|uniref:DUF6546 domain-containing protein n=1 Tax=Bionectria ochroleuca TaxID=29856 RepID=A0ABY6UM46_BIOOC|nr:unnamed protein product [Clonostachys rosea]
MTEAWGWGSLPAEIRNQILEDIAKQRHRGWASFASVSREWQAVLEPKNFLTLKLGTSRLDDLERMTTRSAHLVRHVLLHIELPRYDCYRETVSRASHYNKDYNNMVKDAIVKLFWVLTTWKPRDRLVLELGVSQPSDAEHRCQPRLFEPGASFHVRMNGWSDGNQTEIPSRGTIERFFSPLFHSPPAWLAEVPAVTHLVMRRRFRRHMHPAGVRHFPDHRALVQALASRSRRLEHLSVSYMINARQFFESCRPSYKWDSLQSLALTSPVLTPSEDREPVTKLLLAASQAAGRMPKLEDLVLWNGKRGECCAFIYHRDEYSRGDEGSEATLTWRGTWYFNLNDVVASWEKVARIRLEQERLQEDIIHSHGDAIYHLRLPRDVIDPESLLEIRREGTRGAAAGFHGVIGEDTEL